MNLFYIPSLHADAKEITLPEEESKHACRVLRLKNGDQLQLLDGRGGTYTGEIISDHPKHCTVRITEVVLEAKPAKEIHIAIAPTKNIDRIEWFLEKATEIGMTEVSFITCSNSERKQIKEDRLEKILIAAMKQSKRSFLPVMNPLASFKEFVTRHPGGAIAHCEDDNKSTLKDVYQQSNFPILIGPEGDFTREEIDFASNHGYSFVSLGTTRLRTETAGVYAAVICSVL